MHFLNNYPATCIFRKIFFECPTYPAANRFKRIGKIKFISVEKKDEGRFQEWKWKIKRGHFRFVGIGWNSKGKLTFFRMIYFTWIYRVSRRDGCMRVGALFPELSPASNGFWIHSGPFSTFSLSIFHREKREIRRERERELVSSMINPLITYLPV